MAQAAMAQAIKMTTYRVVMLLIALLGSVAVAMAWAFPLAVPIPVTLVAFGMTTFALVLLLFISLWDFLRTRHRGNA